MIEFSPFTLYRIQCFRVNILKNCSMLLMSQCFSLFFNVFQCFSMFFNVFQCFSMFLNVSQCLSIFFNFFPIFWLKKGRLNFNFITNLTLLIKNRKLNMGLNICLHCTIFCSLKMLTIFEKIATLKPTLNRNQCWNFDKHCTDPYFVLGILSFDLPQQHYFTSSYYSFIFFSYM